MEPTCINHPDRIAVFSSYTASGSNRPDLCFECAGAQHTVLVDPLPTLSFDFAQPC